MIVIIILTSLLLVLIFVLRSKSCIWMKWVNSYGITTADRNTIKKIAGKIIPAISTTTAFVTGTISLELLKIACELKKIENYRSCFANLSMPMFCFTEPGPCHKTTIGSMTWSEWDHIFFKKVEGYEEYWLIDGWWDNWRLYCLYWREV